MAFFNTAVSALLIVCLAVSFSVAAAHDPFLPTDAAAPTSFPADEAFPSDFIVDVAHDPSLPTDVAAPAEEAFSSDYIVDAAAGSTIDVALSPDISVRLPSVVADSPDFTVSADEASEARDMYSVMSSILETSPAPAPFNYAPIVDAATIPADEAEKDMRFVEKYLQIAAHNTDKFLKEVVVKMLKNAEDEALPLECAEICEQMFLSSEDALQKGLSSVLSEEYFGADVEVSAFSSNIHTCSECYGAAVVPELQKFENWATGVTNACLERIAKHTS